MDTHTLIGSDMKERKAWHGIDGTFSVSRNHALLNALCVLLGLYYLSHSSDSHTKIVQQCIPYTVSFTILIRTGRLGDR